MKATILTLLFIIASSISSWAQSPELASIISQANSACPISMGAAGEITYVYYQNGSIIYHCAINDGMIDIDALRSRPDLTKESILSTYRNATGEDRNFLDLLNKYNANLTYIYKNKRDGKEASVTISSNELKEAAASSKNPIEALKEYAELSNMQLPMKVANGFYLQQYSIENSCIVVTYSMDESIYSIDKLNGNRVSLKDQQMEELTHTTDLTVKAFLEKVKKANYGLVYRYIGNSSGKQCEVYFTPSEVEEL